MYKTIATIILKLIFILIIRTQIEWKYAVFSIQVINFGELFFFATKRID